MDVNFDEGMLDSAEAMRTFLQLTPRSLTSRACR